MVVLVITVVQVFNATAIASGYAVRDPQGGTMKVHLEGG